MCTCVPWLAVLGGRKLDFHSATCSSSATTLEVGEEGGRGNTVQRMGCRCRGVQMQG